MAEKLPRGDMGGYVVGGHVRSGVIRRKREAARENLSHPGREPEGPSRVGLDR